MKGCKIKKKDRRYPVFVAEVKKDLDKPILPKKLITKVHQITRPKQVAIKLGPSGLEVPLS